MEAWDAHSDPDEVRAAIWAARPEPRAETSDTSPPDFCMGEEGDENLFTTKASAFSVFVEGQKKAVAGRKGSENKALFGELRRPDSRPGDFITPSGMTIGQLITIITANTAVRRRPTKAKPAQ